jgi:NOL1/NOP2/sun family putative RNA methylase
MRQYFQDHPGISAEGFFESFDQTSYKGIRLNRLKVTPEQTDSFLGRLDGNFSEVPWCRDGYYAEDFSAGKDPFYHAGTYYIQEPSAMLPAEVLGARPGEMVLDLCAAPGGKTTRIGADMAGRGLLVANEISEDRAKALLRNVELFGLQNTVITNESPEKLQKAFPSFFDRILIDAPCSGEGMFRRDRNAVKSWETYGPESCEKLQRSILAAAHIMLKPGGHLVYSTCTFNPGENEDMMAWFMKTYGEYRVVEHRDIKGVTHLEHSSGNGMMRIWPHYSPGDGHFCAHLVKSEDAEQFPKLVREVRGSKYETANVYSVRTAKESLSAFAEGMMSESAAFSFRNRMKSGFYLQGDKIHLLSVHPDHFHQIRVIKMGDFPGEVKSTGKGIVFTPSHAMALSLRYQDVDPGRRLSFRRDDDRLRRYLSGETIQLTDEESDCIQDRTYILIAAEEFPIGFAKREGIILKNMYPKAWRYRH